MTFLLPIGLFALLTLPIILIFHLMRERRRRVAVPSLMHWLNVPRKHEGERIRRLPLTLLLLLHLLAAALLGLALGRPQLLGAFGSEQKHLAIVLDTSTSMAAQESGTSRFALAQERARAALRTLAPSDRATLIAVGSTARLVAESSGTNVAGLIAAVDSLQVGGTGFDLDQALTLAEASFDKNMRREITVITDGASPEAPETPTRNLAAALDWQRVGGDVPNRAIVDLAARPWGGNVQIYARVANYGPLPAQTSVRLYGDGELLGTRPATIAASGETELTWTLARGYAQIRAEVDGQDALAADDAAFLNLVQTRPVRALLVSDKPATLQRVLAAVPGVTVTAVAPSAYAANGAAYDLTVFDGTLPPAWPAGASLAINPPAGGLLDIAGQARRPEGELAQVGPLVSDLSFGGVNFGPVQMITPPAWADARLSYGNVPLVLRGRDGAHEIAIWAFDLASSNLPTRLAFPLLVSRTVHDLTPPPLPQSVAAGTSLSLLPDARATEVSVSAPDGKSTTLAATPSVTLDGLNQPGMYRIEERGNGAVLFRGAFAVNAGSAAESDLRARPAPSIAASDGGTSGEPQREMSDIWPWLALAALAILMLEWGYVHR